MFSVILDFKTRERPSKNFPSETILKSESV